ncbi:MAG: hypothetical protein DI595_20510, partial [Agrobacterium fabrum]
VDVKRLRDKLALYLGLDWIYADEMPPVPATPAPTKPRSPGPAHLEELLRLGEIGYVRGIEAKLADLARLDGNAAFVETSKSFVQGFDMTGYIAFLKTFQPGKEETRG